MQGSIVKRNWWGVLVGAGILVIAVTLIQQNLLPEYDLAVFLIDMIILAIAFYWVYSIDQVALWWAEIPALAMLTLLATGIVAYFTPKDASGSSPYGVITMGLGAVVMGMVIKRPAVKLIMFMIAMITLLVGVVMLPVTIIWKVVFIIVEVALIVYLIWKTASLQRIK
jgi:hypothetical protein